VTNTVAEVFSDRIYEASSSTTGSVSATVWDRASVPTQPVSPNTRRDALLGLLLGAMLGVGLAFLLEYRDGSCRSPKEAEQITGVPTFGVIPRLDEAS
jgi:capsular polysaccharide biosynthesis protein